MKGERAQELHNRGQTHRSEGRYEKPHGILEDLTTWSNDGMKRIAEENNEYRKGYHHTDDQIRRSR